MQVKFQKSGKYFGLTSSREQEYCIDYAMNIFKGDGEIVETGPFLGSLTKAIASGLLKRYRLLPDKFIHVYDSWICYDWFFDFSEWMQENKIDTSCCKKETDSFFPIFKEQMGWLFPMVKVYDDITTCVRFDKDIEFLVVDAMKSWELANAILSKFYTKLIVGSYVFHQDFKFHQCPWIHLIQWRLNDYFEIVANIPDSIEGTSHTVVFKNIKKIPDELLLRRYACNDFKRDDIISAYSFWSKMVPHKLIDRAKEEMLTVK